MYASRRHGREQIVGYASSGSYPEIGSLELFADNRYGGSLQGMVSIPWRKAFLNIVPKAGWEHRRMIYLMPRREWMEEDMTITTDFSAGWLLSGKSLIKADAGISLRQPTSNLLTLPYSENTEQYVLNQLVRDDFEGATSGLLSLYARAEYVIAITKKIGIGVSAGYSYSHYACGIDVTGFKTGVYFKF